MPEASEPEGAGKVQTYGEPPLVAGKYLLNSVNKNWAKRHKMVKSANSDELIYERNVKFCKELFLSWDNNNDG